MALSKQRSTLSRLSIILLGEEWSGRSSTGNTILGRSEFQVHGTSPEPLTAGSGDVEGRRVTVVNTPGWDPGCHPKVPLRILERGCGCVSWDTGQHPHALLLTVPIFLDMEWNQMVAKRLLKLFDDNIWRHTILLFTKADLLGSTSLEKYLEGSGRPLQALVEKCERRYHALNNQKIDNRKQVIELLDKIDQMVAENGGKTFQLVDSSWGEKAMIEHQTEALKMNVLEEQLKEMMERQAKLEEEQREQREREIYLRPEKWMERSLRQEEEYPDFLPDILSSAISLYKTRWSLRWTCRILHLKTSTWKMKEMRLYLAFAQRTELKYQKCTVNQTYKKQSLRRKRSQQLTNFSSSEEMPSDGLATRIYEIYEGTELCQINTKEMQNQQSVEQKEHVREYEWSEKEPSVKQACEDRVGSQSEGECLSHASSRNLSMTSNDEELQRQNESDSNDTNRAEGLTVMEQPNLQGSDQQNGDEKYADPEDKDYPEAIKTEKPIDAFKEVRDAYEDAFRQVEETHVDEAAQEAELMKKEENNQLQPSAVLNATQTWGHLKNGTENFIVVYNQIDSHQQGAVRIDVLQVFICWRNPNPPFQTASIYFTICCVSIDRAPFVIRFLFVIWFSLINKSLKRILLSKQPKVGDQNENTLVFPGHQQQPAKERHQWEHQEDPVLLDGGDWTEDLDGEMLQPSKTGDDEGIPQHNLRGDEKISQYRDDSKKINDGTPQNHSGGNDVETPQHSRKGNDGETPQHSRKGKDGGISQHSRKGKDGGIPQHNRECNEGGIPQHSRKGKDGGIPQHKGECNEGGIPQHSWKGKDGGIPQHSWKGNDEGTPKLSKKKDEGIVQHSKKNGDREIPQHNRKVNSPTGATKEEGKAPGERCPPASEESMSSRNKLNHQGDTDDGTDPKGGFGGSERGHFSCDPTSVQTDFQRGQKCDEQLLVRREEFRTERKARRRHSLERIVTLSCRGEKDMRKEGSIRKTRRSKSLERFIEFNCEGTPKLSRKKDERIVQHSKKNGDGEIPGHSRKVNCPTELKKTSVNKPTAVSLKRLLMHFADTCWPKEKMPLLPFYV